MTGKQTVAINTVRAKALIDLDVLDNLDIFSFIKLNLAIVFSGIVLVHASHVSLHQRHKLE